MTPLTVEELQQILDKTGLSKNAIEKKFGMGNGSIGKFLIGKLNSLPDKYVAKIRKLEKEVESNKPKISMINTTVNVGNDEAFDKIQEILDNYKPDPNQEWFNDTGERPIDFEASRGRDEKIICLPEKEFYNVLALDVKENEPPEECEDIKKDVSWNLQFVKDTYEKHKKDIKRPLIDKNLLP